MPDGRICREQIEEAARMAYAMDLINKMDNGRYHHRRKRRTAFRRSAPAYRDFASALLRDSPILILMKLRPRWIPNSNVIQGSVDELQKTVPSGDCRIIGLHHRTGG
ncbi:hypothetical protein KCP71_22475 [Salmonella enterica subsp. enterica]|nr:hypothetical protein KCP71_22475 [Salmonella enterica subsp. enterica]